MLTLLFIFIFSKAGMIGVGGLLIIGAVAATVLRLPRWVAIGLAVAAAVHIYSGTIYQHGRAAERAVWETALKVEQDRQRAAASQADALAAQLAAERTRFVQALDERQRQHETEIIALEAEEQAAAAAAGSPACRCVDSERDVQRLRDLLR